MFFIINPGVLSSTNFLSSGGAPQAPTAIVTMPTGLLVGVPISATYVYNSPIAVEEANELPYADDIVLSPEVEVGQTITATVTGLKIPNGAAAGSHVYSWYRANDKKGTGETMIATGSSNTHLIQEASDARYLRCKFTATQSTGGNLTGYTISSPWSARINSPSFNPFFDIEWVSAYTKEDLVTFDSELTWANRGIINELPSPTGPITQDGVANYPNYDAVEEALRFTSADTERLSLPKAYSPYPVEFWVRFKLASDPTANMNMFGFNNSTFIRFNSSNQFQISGGTCATTVTDNQWYVARIHFSADGISSTIELNNSGTPETFTSSTVGLGTSGLGRIGCSFGQSNFFNGWISHIFASPMELDSGQQANMWTWFEL